MRVRADVEPTVLGHVGGAHVVGEAPRPDRTAPPPWQGSAHPDVPHQALVTVAHLHARMLGMAPLGHLGRSVGLGHRTAHLHASLPPAGVGADSMTFPAFVGRTAVLLTIMVRAVRTRPGNARLFHPCSVTEPIEIQ